MTDNFDQYRQFIEEQGGLPDTNDGELDKCYTIALMRRGKDNPNMPAANYRFKTYHIYSWNDFERYKPEIKIVCDAINLRAYASVNYKMMSQVALDTMAELSRRIAAHDTKRFYTILQSCTDKYIDKKNTLWIVDIDDAKIGDKKTEEIEKIVENAESEYEKNVVFKMPTKSGVHLITHPFNIKKYIWAMKDYGEIPEVKKNQQGTLLYENIKTHQKFPYI